MSGTAGTERAQHGSPEGRPRPAPPDLVERRRAGAAALAALPLADGVTVADVDADGVQVLACLPPEVELETGPVLLYFHGGGYRLGSARLFQSYASHVATACGARLLSVDYPLAPENPYPAALRDATTVYRWLLGTGVAPDRIVLGGDSAGGGLAAALLLSIAAEGLGRPAGAVLLSPWVDLRVTAGSFQQNARTDELFSAEAAREAAGMYLAGHPATDPLASPLLGDWAGQPPMLIHASADEVLRDDAQNLADTARAAGVDVRLELYPAQAHVWHLRIPFLDAAVSAVDDVARFVRAVVPRGASTPEELSPAERHTSAPGRLGARPA
ncbi:MAG: Alpha/beta hydrolase fold-3 domain protein [Frankiales bacterium]|nr:Alpha/beta hydrolase fold-3 domain protein [Frankiales bacterium]